MIGTMKATVIFSLLVSLASGMRFTALEIDNHPCKPENLRHTNRYICDNHGNVICQSGWKEPEIRDAQTELNPCLEPICNHNGMGCLHGECRAPNFCACEVGWEGTNCDICVPLPGCAHGSCTNAFECNCDEGWEGAYCDIPSCNNCTNGQCITPNECVCSNGWSGESCDVCQPMAGCIHGRCVDHPNTCVCEEGWEGHLCDKPSCKLDCNHGFCYASGVANSTNFCICHSGWRGESCDKCSPYWRCPNQGDDACHLPNECLCFKNEKDPDLLCNNTLLNSNNFNENRIAAMTPLFDNE